MVNKDYYAILGIDRWANDEEIKRAYKQKALKYHPDKNRDDLNAAKTFTEIREAYEMLSDPFKRSMYDQLGSNISADTYLIRSKDSTTFHDLYVTLEEINAGATRKLKITRKRFQFDSNSTIREEKVLEVPIKPGWKEGTKITFESEGDAADPRTLPGDIVFIIRDKAHPIFERSNADLIYRVKLTLKEALLGTLVVIPFLDTTKKPYLLRTYREILTPQCERRFLNEGLPYPKDPQRRGDLIVKFDILFPKLINEEQRRWIDKAFSNSMEFYQSLYSPLHHVTIDPKQDDEQSTEL